MPYWTENSFLWALLGQKLFLGPYWTQLNSKKPIHTSTIENDSLGPPFLAENTLSGPNQARRTMITRKIEKPIQRAREGWKPIQKAHEGRKPMGFPLGKQKKIKSIDTSCLYFLLLIMYPHHAHFYPPCTRTPHKNTHDASRPPLFSSSLLFSTKTPTIHTHQTFSFTQKFSQENPLILSLKNFEQSSSSKPVLCILVSPLWKSKCFCTC